MSSARAEGAFPPLALAALALVLSSCASAPPNAGTSYPVACRSNADCDRKWSRAAAWVAANADYPIETRTAELIQTAGPAGKSDGMTMRVGRRMAPDGSGELMLDIRCASLTLGCIVDPQHEIDSFAAYVSGSTKLIVAMPPRRRPEHPIPLLGNPLALFW